MNASFGALLRTLPTLLVLAGLAGLYAWGHLHGFAIARKTAVAEPDDWCADHKVPESRCVRCHPELIGQDPKDWCREHGVPESKCLLCHPELAKDPKAADWCSKHGVPEASCTICHPEIALPAEAPPAEAQVTLAPGVTPDPKTCQNHLLQIQLASAAAIAKNGIGLAGVAQRAITQTVTAPGELEYVPERSVQVAAPVEGRVARVLARLGDKVEAGAPLLWIELPEIGRLKTEALQALVLVESKARTLQTVAALVESGLRTESDLQLARSEALLAQAQARAAIQALSNTGLFPEAVKIQEAGDAKAAARVEALGRPPGQAPASLGLVELKAPAAGTVVTQQLVLGEAFAPGRLLCALADTSVMQATLAVRLEHARLLAPGQQTYFTVDGLEQEAASGAITWISPEVDHKTRAVLVRVHLGNAQQQLRANAFGEGRIVVRATGRAIVVPETAVHWEGCCHVVFVQASADRFAVRKVQVGARMQGVVEINVGVLPGEVVATTGSHVLKSAMLAHRLGAGCCGGG